MSFGLDRYEPVAFHTHPELMRAAEARTAVLHPAPPGPAVPPAPVTTATPLSPPTPVAAAPTPTPTTPATPTATPTPAEPIAAYVVGMDATPLLRSSLADFLDGAGARRDVRVSVGVATGTQVSWVLRDQVPHGVRAMPRYPDGGSPPDSRAALAATAAAVVADAAEAPDRRQLVVLLWDRPPEPGAAPAALASALVLHCVDAVIVPPATAGPTATSWVLARSRPGSRPSLLAHAGRLLDRWESFADPPAGLWLAPRPEGT